MSYTKFKKITKNFNFYKRIAKNYGLCKQSVARIKGEKSQPT